LTEAAASHGVRRVRKRPTCPGIWFRPVAKKPVVPQFEFQQWVWKADTRSSRLNDSSAQRRTFAPDFYNITSGTDAALSIIARTCASVWLISLGGKHTDPNMFANKTVFILGAGASWDYGYPTGEDLIKNVIAKARIAVEYFTSVLKNPGFKRHSLQAEVYCPQFSRFTFILNNNGAEEGAGDGVEMCHR
jgi:hypothetical protein